jgi:hypothetical protein
MLPRVLRPLATICIFTLALTACTPHYNWREVRPSDQTFVVLLPGKAASFTRTISLGQHQLPMTMTAAEVDSTTFAVGVLTLPPTLTHDTAIEQMAAALANNIGGTAVPAQLPVAPGTATARHDIMVTGTHQGQATQLFARLMTVNNQVYQIIMLTTGSPIQTEHTETFFTSFKPVDR